MNIFDLDQIAERIHQLDLDDELPNCTSKLVGASYLLTAAVFAIARCEPHSHEERAAITAAQACREEVLAALKPFGPH